MIVNKIVLVLFSLALLTLLPFQYHLLQFVNKEKELKIKEISLKQKEVKLKGILSNVFKEKRNWKKKLSEKKENLYLQTQNLVLVSHELKKREEELQEKEKKFERKGKEMSEKDQELKKKEEELEEKLRIEEKNRKKREKKKIEQSEGNNHEEEKKRQKKDQEIKGFLEERRKNAPDFKMDNDYKYLFEISSNLTVENVAGKKIALIIPYVKHKVPKSMHYVLKSFSKNKLLELFFFTDKENEDFPEYENVHVVVMPNLIEYVVSRLFKLAFNTTNLPEYSRYVDVIRNTPYWFVLLKQSFGYVFQEFIPPEKYSYWGWLDIDVLFGDASKLLEENKYYKYEVVTFGGIKNKFLYTRGQLTILQNTNKCNLLFLLSKCFKEMLLGNIFFCKAELHFSTVFFYHSNISFMDIRLQTEDIDSDHSTLIWKNGELIYLPNFGPHFWEENEIQSDCTHFDSWLRYCVPEIAAQVVTRRGIEDEESKKGIVRSKKIVNGIKVPMFHFFKSKYLKANVTQLTADIDNPNGWLIETILSKKIFVIRNLQEGELIVAN